MTLDHLKLAINKKPADTSTYTRGVKDQKALQTGTIVRQLANAIEHDIDNLLARGVVTTRIIVGRILLAVDDLLGMVELLHGSGAHFVADGRFQIAINGTRDVLARGRFRKERRERVVAVLAIGHAAVRFNAVLEAVQFPALVTRLDTSLTEVERDAFCL